MDLDVSKMQGMKASGESFQNGQALNFGSKIQPAWAGYTESAQTVFGKFERCDIRNQSKEHLEIGLIEISLRPKTCTTTKNSC